MIGDMYVIFFFFNAVGVQGEIKREAEEERQTGESFLEEEPSELGKGRACQVSGP